MRNSSEIWCETDDISIEEINNRACKEVEKGNFPTLCLISLDLLAVLQKGVGGSVRMGGGGLGGSIMSINTTVGSINIQPVRRLRNFLLVARREDFDAMTQIGIDQIFWNDEERKRIDKAFEDLVIMEGES